MRRRVIEVNVQEKNIVPRQSWLAQAYLWLCERLYAELAWAYDWISWLVSAGQWRHWQGTVWRNVSGRDILEMGCGTGAMLVDGIARGYRMVGVDRSLRMLVVAQRRCLRIGGQSLLVQGEGRALSMPDQSFDAVITTFPAGYILERETLAELRRVLRTEGKLVIAGLWVELHVGAVGRWMPVFYGRPPAERLEGIVRHINDAGFRARWDERREGVFTVGNLVAEREL